MKFEHLYGLVNEVPHVFLPDELSVDIDLTKVDAIDYCAEKWTIPNELKLSVAKSLYELTGYGLLPIKKNGTIYIHDFNTKKETDLIEHEEALKILEDNDIDVSRLVVDFLNNEHYFRYCTADKCFVRKKKKGTDFVEYEDN